VRQVVAARFGAGLADDFELRPDLAEVPENDFELSERRQRMCQHDPRARAAAQPIELPEIVAGVVTPAAPDDRFATFDPDTRRVEEKLLSCGVVDKDAIAGLNTAGQRLKHRTYRARIVVQGRLPDQRPRGEDGDEREGRGAEPSIENPSQRSTL